MRHPLLRVELPPRLATGAANKECHRVVTHES
jgi:hypothetical protein